MINYYEILGVDNFSDIDKIKKMYRKLSMVHHPDMGWTQKKFIELNTAYWVLNDAKSKEKYDTELKLYIEECNKPKEPIINTPPPKEDIKNSYQSKDDTIRNKTNYNSYVNENNTRSRYYTNEDDENEEYDDYDEEEENGISISESIIFLFKRIWQITKYIFSVLKFIFSKDFIFFLKESINFRGRIWRMSFVKRVIGWFITLFYMIQFLSFVSNNFPIVLDYVLFIILSSIYVIYFLSSILKRYNDLEYKKWYLLLFLIPYINFIMFWILILKKWEKKL